MLTIILTILFLLLLILALCLIDFRGGKADHHKKAAPARFMPERLGHAQLIGDGNAFFQLLFEDIEQAQDHVHLSFFIWKERGIGDQLLSLLDRRAREGIQICLLIDRLGCSIKRTTLNRLKDAGVTFSYTHSPKFPYYFYNLNRRYHRKIAVIDQKIAYLGGFNVGNEYVGKDRKYGFWRDLHVRLEGEITLDLQQLFLDDWENAGAPAPKPLPPAINRTGDQKMKLFVSEGKGMAEQVDALLQRAKHSIIIVTPYYIPGKKLQQTLVEQVQIGVSVEILIPEIEDHPLVKAAAYAYIPELIKSGCNVYEYTEGFYHGKAIVIDGKEAEIGSANFDKRSFHLNDELDLHLPNGEFVQTISSELRNDIAGARKLTMEDVQNRNIVEKAKTKVASAVSEFL